MLNNEGFNWGIFIAGCIIWTMSVIHLDIVSTVVKDFLGKFNKKK